MRVSLIKSFFSPVSKQKRILARKSDRICISECQKAELQLRRSLALLGSIIDNAPMRVFWKSRDFHYLGCNKLYAQDAGVANPEDLLGKNDYELVWKDQADEYRADDLKVMQTGMAKLNYVESQTTPDNQTLWLMTSKVPLRSPDTQEIIGVLGISTDITDWKSAQKALAASELELRQLADSMLQVVWVARPDGFHTYFNQQWFDYSGLTPEASLGFGWSDSVHPDDRPLALNRWQSCLQNGSELYMECRIRDRHGDYQWWLVKSRPICDENGETLKWFGTCTNIHQLKLKEEQIRFYEARWQFALDGSGIGVWDWHIPSGETFFSKSCKSMLGYADDEILSDIGEWSKRLHPDDARDAWEHIKKHWRDETPVCDHEYRLRNQMGDYRWMHVRGMVIERDETGKPLRMIGTISDVTERHDELQELQSYRLRLEELVEIKTQQLLQAKAEVEAINFLSDQALELARSGYWCINFREGDQYYVSSPRTVEIFGDPPREGYRYHIMNDWYVNIAVVDEEAAKTTLANYLAAVDGSIPGYDMIHPYKRPSDGRIIWVHVMGQVTRDAEGNPANVYGVVMDITATRMAENALKEAREVALKASKAKSEFLANMSHEIRTPMNGVIGLIDVLMQSPLNEHQLRIVQIIRDSAYTQLTIINDLLDFSKIEAGKMEIIPEPFFIDTFMESVCGMLDQMALENQVDFKLFVDPTIPELIQGDVQRLRQIITNLINNAIKFSSGLSRQGEVTVRAHLLEYQVAKVWIRFTVSDNGIGISEEVQSRLFQQFEQADASTTRKYGGTGLGLVICRRLLEMMGGQIRLQSVVDQGSNFTFDLPFDVPAQHEHVKEAGMAGLNCLIIGNNSGLNADIGVLLEHFGAKVNYLPDVGTVFSLLPPDQRLWFWVYDLFDNAPLSEMEAVADRYIKQHGANIAIKQLGVGRGRRRKARLLTRGIAQVDGNLMTRRMLLKSLSILFDETSSAYQINRKIAAPFSQSMSRDEAISKQRLILVAEDNEVNQQVIIEQLKLLGFVTDMVSNGQEALTQWLSYEYPLILSDIHMPVMDGFELAKAIRHKEAEMENHHTILVALTALAMKGEAENCKLAGFDDHLTKPTPLNDLQVMLEKWLPQKTELMISASSTPLNDDSDSRTSAPKLASAWHSLPEWDETALAQIVGPNPEQHRKFLTLFLTQAEQKLGEFQAPRDDQQMDTLGKMAHALKSSARSVGAMRVGEICQVIESSCKQKNLGECQFLCDELQKEFDVFQRLVRQQSTNKSA